MFCWCCVGVFISHICRFHLWVYVVIGRKKIIPHPITRLERIVEAIEQCDCCSCRGSMIEHCRELQEVIDVIEPQLPEMWPEGNTVG